MGELKLEEGGIANRIYSVELSFYTVTNTGRAVNIDVVYIDDQPWFCLEDVINAITGESYKRLLFDAEIQPHVASIRIGVSPLDTPNSILVSVISLQGLRLFGTKCGRSCSTAWIIRDFNIAADLHRDKSEERVAARIREAQARLKAEEDADCSEADELVEAAMDRYGKFTKKQMLAFMLAKLDNLAAAVEKLQNN